MEAGRLGLKLVSTVAPLDAMGVELGNVPQEAILLRPFFWDKKKIRSKHMP